MKLQGAWSRGVWQGVVARVWQGRCQVGVVRAWSRGVAMSVVKWVWQVGGQVSVARAWSTTCNKTFGLGEFSKARVRVRLMKSSGVRVRLMYGRL